ncbi:MAG: ATP-binding protein [Trichococcus flocculiformis]
MAIVKSIIKKHNGTVRVVSEIGKGAAFTVTLPLEHIRT